MRREDIFMDLIGELDDNYIALAMSRPKRRAIVSETRNITFVQPVEVENNVSKRELRLYYITRVLGMAAVTFLIVGAAVLLIMNWDKIVVRDPDTPPVVTTDVTTVTEPSIITTDIDDSSKSNAPTVTFEEMKQMLYYKDHCITLPCSVFDITRLDSLLTASAESGEGSSMYFIKRNDELICSLTVATSGTDIDIPEGTQLISLAIRSGEDFSLFDGKIKLGTTLDEVKALLGEPKHNDEYPDYSYNFTNGGETIAINDMRFDDDGKLTQMPDIVYIGDPADRFSQITDTSMPRPFPIEQDYDHMPFESQWNTKCIGIFGDSSRDGFIEWQQYLMTVTTPYTLYDNNCIAGAIKALGYTAEEIEEKFTQNNERWQEKLKSAEKDNNEGAIINCRNMIFSDEEINALISGDEAEIIRLFISDHSIWIKDKNYVISPWWLYYHTIEDYKAVGVTPEMIAEKLPLYEDTFIGKDIGTDMADESWTLFKAKLESYIISGKTIPDDMLGEWSVADVTDNAFSEQEFGSDNLESLNKMLDSLGNNDVKKLYKQAYALCTLTERDYDDLSNDNLLKQIYGDFQYSSERAVLLDISGSAYACNSGYLWESFVSAYKSVFEDDYADRLIADMPCVYHYGKELYYSGVTSTLRVMLYPVYTVLKNTADEIVIRETCYNIDYQTREVTNEIRYINENRFLKTSDGWRCAYFGINDTAKAETDRFEQIREYLFNAADEGLDDRAFAILENVFYGEWSSSPENEPTCIDCSFTYSKDRFTLEGTIPRGIIETDDVYILTFTNVGVATCYVIEKSAPDVMYLTDYDYYPDRNSCVRFDVTSTPKYINRKAEKPEIKSGEISVLGLKKLFNIYGRKFEESFTDLLEKDKSEGVDFDGQKLYPTGKDIYRFGEATPYLGTLTDDEVRILMPYYYEDDSGNATELYAEMWFSKYYNGDWGSGTNVSITPDASGLKINGKPIPNNELEEFDLDAMTGIVFSANNKTIKELNNFLDTINDKELVQQYKRAYVLRTVAFASDDVAATLVDDTGKVAAVSTGFTFESVMNAYLQVFKSEYVSDLFADLHFYRYGDELFCAGVSVSTPDCIIEYVFNSPDDSPDLAVFAVMGYAKDEKTGKKTDEIVLSKDAIFELSSVGWRCRHFGISDRTQ